MATATTERDGQQLLLGKRETARLLGLGVSTLERYSEVGYCPRPKRIGHVLRWNRRELEDWLAAGCPRG